MALISPSLPQQQHLKKLSKKQQQQQKSTVNGKGSGRLLITVNVLGSAGPIRFLVNEEEPVASVIQSALKVYAREGRLPVLGADLSGFFLYCANVDGTLGPWEAIGTHGSRNFLLCKKPAGVNMDEGRSDDQMGRKASGNWKAWLNKSLNYSISSH